MAMAPSFFGKREPVNPPQRQASGSQNTTGSGAASNTASSTAAHSTPSPSPSPSPQPGSEFTVVTPVTASPPEGGSKLTVGPNIKLKGVEITDCDTLVVEGIVEATMDSRVIQISERGAFKGSAEIDIAEIHGHFDGNLTVRQKLIIYSTGKVTGKVSYGKLIIEEGGQLSGDIRFGGAANAPTNGNVDRLGLSVAR
jgi:cytoskeletal protein CcmA (bactofilin family)